MKEYKFRFFWRGDYGKLGSTEVKESRDEGSSMSKDDIVTLIKRAPGKPTATFLEHAEYYWWYKNEDNYVRRHIADKYFPPRDDEVIQLDNNEIVYIQILPTTPPPTISMPEKNFQGMSGWTEGGGRFKRKRKKSKSTKKLTKRRRKSTKKLTKRRRKRTRK